MSTSGGYHEYIGGCSVHLGILALTVVYHGSRILMVLFVLFVKRILKV